MNYSKGSLIVCLYPNYQCNHE